MIRVDDDGYFVEWVKVVVGGGYYERMVRECRGSRRWWMEWLQITEGQSGE